MKVIFLTGPTACGKSGLAFEIAKVLQSQGRKVCILNCDSVQVYQGVSIGSAQPSAEEANAVPHYLYGEVLPPTELTAGEFARMFLQKLSELKAKNELVLAVGGSGFYIQSILKGMFETAKADSEVQSEIFKSLSLPGVAEQLHAELSEKDPTAAKRIHVNDHYRLSRAIEILRATGQSVTELHSQKKQAEISFPYDFQQWVIDIPREELRLRVQGRVQKMITLGFVDEVKKLMAAGFAEWAPMNSVGYLQVKEALLSGAMNPQELSEKICIATMQLAKKQRTWFQRPTDYESKVIRMPFSETKLEHVMTKVGSFID